MSHSLGIVGLPNVGKSTLFSALTKKQVDAQNYPFCTIDPSVGLVPVPDPRLERLHTFSESEKKIPAAFEFVDIAGLVAGAHEGEGLGNKFLSNIREVDAIAHMVRIFEDDSVTHVHGSIDPLHDIEVINTELIMRDLQTVTNRREKLAGDVRTGDSEAQFADGILQRIEEALDEGRLVSELKFDDGERRVVRELHLLTDKRMLYVLNRKSDGENIDESRPDVWEDIRTYFKEHNAQWVTIDAGLEQEMVEMSDEEKETFRKEVGQKSGVDELIKEGYRLLNLITFFTTGKKETRGWTIEEGSTAPEAGAAIHTDFKENFIKAEVVHWDELLGAGSYADAREQGLLRTEGKDYIVQDGDVITFKV